MPEPEVPYQTIGMLGTRDHDRDAAGLTYVYPVVSRRSGGVSVGINLNPNNACNWRCLYCQVPGLVRGSAPRIDLPQLERELDGFLREVLHGRFMSTRVPRGARRLRDIAISGNGEPTSAREFDQVVERVAALMQAHGLLGRVPLVLITNGSLVRRQGVQRGLARLAEARGEAWFKLDRATAAGLRFVNGTTLSPAAVLRNLRMCAQLCDTRLQTCVFCLDGMPPSRDERDAWLELVETAVKEGVALKGVMIYGIAREPMQPEAARLTRVSPEWLAAFKAEIEDLGLVVETFD